MSLKNGYLLAAIVGGVVPWIFFARFFGSEGLDLPLFVSSWFVNDSASGAAADLLISSFVFWVWSFTDAREHGVRSWWVIIPVNLLIGLSCALPLYLWMREGAKSSSTQGNHP